MIRPIIVDELHKVMFSFKDDKASDLEGFFAKFFKVSWDIVANEFSSTVINFFRCGRLFRETNATTLALVPKKEVLMSVNDFRPISCYNMVYKCISNILTNQINDSLGDVVDQTQSTFLLGRRINDNLLMAQEIFCNYH
ncbi:hypothetical protein Pint_27912 [Pistacia integerrima]|uniref:Uncharacterized protein n=1 Tax=Pistacia integerrima TaxID=434235 RepID=A0ACC0YQW2_9ROSI|nr:hypothetical protein Pint_27912 [Pistacia integerrima]